MSKRLVLALAAMAACATHSLGAQPVGDADAGANKAAVCAACHGMDGNAPAAEWPNLAGQGTDYIFRQTAMIRDGQRESLMMLPFVQDMSDQDIADIAAYYATLNVIPGVADDSAIADRDETYADLGQRIYRGGKAEAGVPACIACHGPTGRGIPGAGYPAVAGQHATYHVDRLMYFHDGGQYGDSDTDPSTIMVTIAGRLDRTEIDAVATYMEGLHRFDPHASTDAEATPPPAPPADSGEEAADATDDLDTPDQEPAADEADSADPGT